MPSRGPLALLRSQGLGLLCGQATVLLLAVGSFVIPATRDGASADVHMDDLRAFFVAPSPWHTWLYLLAGVLVIYALNTGLCTWDNVVSRWRAGQRSPVAYAAAIVHVSFLVALLAHLVGGLWGQDAVALVGTTGWSQLGETRAARLVDVTTRPNPDGSLRSASVRLALRDATGTREVDVGYNAPYSEGLGSELVLLGRLKATPGGAAVVQLSLRRSPGNPSALLAALLLATGMGLMGRRWALPVPPAPPAGALP